jgi:pimeloyl-ACP methyl ester carboxylesterase
MKLIAAKTVDDLCLNGLMSQSSSKNIVVIHIHGMQGDFYSNLEPFFTGYPEKNVAFLAGENRGSYVVNHFKMVDGSDRVIGGAYETFEECVHDIKAWIDFAESQGYQNIWLSSHSLATAKVVYYMQHTNDRRVKGLIFLSPADNVGLVKDPMGAADHAICYPEAIQLYNVGKGTRLLSHLLWGDKMLSANTYLNLFQDDSASNVFHYYDPTLSWGIIQNLSVPVMAISGTKDDGIEPVMEPHAAMELLEYHLMHSLKVKTLVLDGAEHSFIGFEKQIIEQVVSFIEAP